MIGDINIDILNVGRRESLFDDYMNILAGFGFASCINLPTHDRHCLDHVFMKTTLNNYTVTPFILHSKITDHCPVGVRVRNEVSIGSCELTLRDSYFCKKNYQL